MGIYAAAMLMESVAVARTSAQSWIAPSGAVSVILDDDNALRNTTSERRQKGAFNPPTNPLSPTPPKIPAIAFGMRAEVRLRPRRRTDLLAAGTGSIYKRTDVTCLVTQALDAGFAHIDTASCMCFFTLLRKS